MKVEGRKKGRREEDGDGFESWKILNCVIAASRERGRANEHSDANLSSYCLEKMILSVTLPTCTTNLYEQTGKQSKKRRTESLSDPSR